MPVILQALMWTTFVSIMTGVGITAVDPNAIEDCSGAVSILTLCNGAFVDLLGIAAFGTVPGAPFLINVLFGIIGLYARGQVVWAIFQLARGSG